jgi:predicted DNA-binding transcriptional regulator AlpA
MNSTLMTMTQIAQEFGIARSTLSAYKARGQMPEPDKVYGSTPLWRRRTIEKWRAGVDKRRAAVEAKREAKPPAKRRAKAA